MLYVVHAYDGTDPEAIDRRMAARPAHFEGARRLKSEGHFILGGALLSPDGQMIGSMMLLEFTDEAQLQNWMSWEPYIQNKVWEHVDVKPFRQADV
ncbi:YciI family protein [Fibrella aquatica]|uniref:YciI family protein n=1 Tax=Fibrella aquatica TaxID=3242487 RepID=UPI00352128C4